MLNIQVVLFPFSGFSPRRGGRGGRGRGRGGRGGGQRKTPTAEELDAELDAYNSKVSQVSYLVHNANMYITLILNNIPFLNLSMCIIFSDGHRLRQDSLGECGCGWMICMCA